MANKTLEEQKADAVAAEVREYGGSFAEHNVVAAYPDLSSAKKAIDAIEWAGMDAVNVSLLGRTATKASDVRTNPETGRADRRLANDVARRSITGIVLGAIVGATVGVLTYLVYDDLGIWIGVAGGIIIGGTIGGFAGGMWSLDANQQAEVTYHDAPSGHVLVGVSSDEKQRVDRAADILAKKDPLTVHRYDGAGRPI